MFSEWQESWEEFKKSPSYRHICAIARAGLIYLIYALMHFSTPPIQLQAEFIEFRGTLSYQGIVILENAIKLILSLLMLNSVLLTFALFSRDERIAFLEKRTGEYDKKAERRNLLRSPYFLTEIITLILLVFLAPCGESHTEALLTILPGEYIPHPALIRLIHGCFYGIFIFLINLHAHMDSRDYWLELPGRLSKSNFWKSMSVKKKQSYSYSRMVLRLVVYLLIYVYVARLIPVLVITFTSIAIILDLLAASAVVLMLIGLLFSFNYIGALQKRRKFFKKLKKLCKGNGYELGEMNHPYLSVFRETDGYTFSVRANGQTYCARVISCLNRGNHIIFDTKGMLTRVRIFRIPLPRISVARAGYVQGLDRGTGDDRELFRISSEADYTFEAEGKKILILNPPSKFVKIAHEGITRDADNGERVGEYIIYSSGAFLRALDRGAIY